MINISIYCNNYVLLIFLGRLLASGSDDKHIILWDPFYKKKLAELPTFHQANIFSVKVRVIIILSFLYSNFDTLAC